MTQERVYQTETRDMWVKSPHGERLFVRIRQPRLDQYAGQRFPAVILVPGGLSSGDNMDRRINLAELGYVQARFCPPGRGAGTAEDPHSEGEEDCNGFRGQDGLRDAIIQVAGLPQVDPDCVGVLSGSLGVSLAAGALGRYRSLPVKFLLDVEGPSDSEVICFVPWNDPVRVSAAYDRFGHWPISRDPSPENVTWWREREAVHHIGHVAAAYMRVQTDEDHAQPAGFIKSAIDLVNLATDGTSPWTRVNGSDMGNPVNGTYEVDNPAKHPRLLRGHLQNHPNMEPDYVRELTALVRKDRV